MLSQRHVYPKPRFSPPEFQPMTLPGAHFKLEEKEDDEAITSVFRNKTHFDNI